MMKKTIATLASAALVLTNVVSVAATTNANIVTNTGSNFNLDSTANTTNVVTTTSENNAEISQTSVTNNNTGDNAAVGNIDLCCGTGTGITTGNAGSQTTMNVDVNSNTTAVSLPTSGGSSNTAVITNTGSNFNGNLSANTTNVVTVSSENNMAVKQKDFANNNTGDNYTKGNIGSGGSIDTGSAVSVSTMNVAGNDNTTVIEGVGSENPCGTCVGNNNVVTNTGSGFNLDSQTNDTNVLTAYSLNNLYATQTVFAKNNTGGNVSKKNIDPCCTLGSGITTGNAGSVSAFSVDGNTNATGVGLDLPMASNWLDVLNTGGSANLTVSGNSTNVVTASSTNNLRSRQLTFASNTSGDNYLRGNIGGFGTFTGNAGAGSSFGVLGNSNTTLMGGAFDLLLWLALL